MRRFAYFGFAFCCACFVCTLLGHYSHALICAAICVLPAVAGMFFSADIRRRILLIFLGAAMGFSWFFAYNSIFLAPARMLAGTSGVQVSAVVCDSPVATSYGSKLSVKLITDSPIRVKAQMYIYDSDAPQYAPGDIITFDGDFSDSSKFDDNETNVFTSRGIFLFVRCKNAPDITGRESSYKYLHITVRDKLKAMITRLYPNDAAALLTAIITGDKSLINGNTALSTSLERSGAAHIAAVSGMHVVFLSSLLGFFFRRRKLRAAVITPVLIFFMAMTGFTASVVRAGIMQIFMLLAPVFGRERDDITSLSEATFILLVINPYACAGVSLQLSFGATLGILLFSGKIYKAVISPINARIKKRRIITAPLGFIFSSLSTTFSALIFTLPMCAYYFGTVSLAAPLTNLLILWAVSLCFSLGLISCAVGFVFMAPATVIAAVCTLFSKYVLFFINLLGGSYASAVYTTNPAVVIWLVYIYAMFIAFFVFRGSLRRMLLPATLAVVYLCAVIIITPFANVSSTLDITALDVGQGQCLVITCGSYTAVVDCGSSSGEDAGEIAGRYLAGIGRQNIDMLILTHFHSDHSSGVEQLLEYADVSCLVVPSVGTSSQEGDEIISLAIEHNIDVIYVTRDISVSFSDAVFNIIAPMGSSTENERGLTILASRDEYDILITGDMPESIEEKLAAAFDLPDIELLIVGHHGSKYSSCDELLDAVKPEKAIISVGYNNYGHPTQETLQRLSERGIEIYRTDLIGNVSISQW